MAKYVQYGCGLCAPDTWENYDASPRLVIQKTPVLGLMVRGWRFPKNVRYGNIVKGLPVEDGSVDLIYCSHTLEHLTLAHLRQALKNTLRALKPNGVFRFVLPDLKAFAVEYVNSNDPTAAMQFNYHLAFRSMTPVGRIRGILGEVVGNSLHQWMWDYPALKIELENAGFVDVRPAVMGDNPDPNLKQVEVPDRWERALGGECRRPA